MPKVFNTRIAILRRFTVFTAAIAILCGLTGTAWSQNRSDGGKHDNDYDGWNYDDDRDGGRHDKNNDSGKRDIDVATVNLYVGADFTPVLTLDPTDPEYFNKVITGVADIHARILQSNFPERANALAKQIVRRAPDLVALQEVSLIRRQSPGDLILGGTVPAEVVELDYLAILLDALERHGGHYAVASKIEDTDVEVPLFTGASFDDVRLTDRDVILVRTDLPPGHFRISNPQSANFHVALPLPIGVSALRGWCSVDVQVRGRSFRVINTHLEDRLPPGAPNIQLAQASELLADPANTALPVILAGDFNSDAYGYYSPETYAFLTGRSARHGRFTDAWTVAEPRSLGFTWGHDPFLSDVTVSFFYRLDLILYRGKSFEAKEARVVDPIIGRSAPRWFSDHAGVFATLEIE